jgi:hypothetical protein
MHSQRGRWEQGRSPVGRVALIPTLTYLLKYIIVQWKFSYQFLINKKHLLYANSCRDEGNPTYGFYFMRMFINGALENSTLQKYDNMPYFSHKLCFNVKMTLYK